MLSTPHGAKGQGIGHGLAEVIWEDGALGEMELLVIYPQKWLLCQNLLMCNWIVIKVNFNLNYYKYIPRITYNSTGVWNNKYFFLLIFQGICPEWAQIQYFKQHSYNWRKAREDWRKINFVENFHKKCKYRSGRHRAPI